MDDSFDVKFSTEKKDELPYQELSCVFITWKVPNFIKTRRAYKVGQCIKSPELQCAGASWAVNLYPRGTKESKDIANISLTKFNCNHLPADHDVSVKITVPCKGGLDKTTEFYETRIEGTFVESKPLVIMEREKLLNFGYLENGTLTIKFDMTVSGETRKLHKGGNTPKKKNVDKSAKDCNALPLCEIPITEKDDVVALAADIEALYNNPRFADVILEVRNQKFPAHKLVLRSRSKVFEAMFEHDMQENRKDTVDLVDMEVDTVKDMLRYIYSGKVRQLSPEEALSLYVAADRYDLRGLVLKCRKIVLNELSIENICETATVADLHNDQLLMDAVKSFLYKNMKKVFATEKWMIFSKENQTLSLNLIQSAVMNN